MALGQAARTIRDYLHTLEENEQAEVGHFSYQGRSHPPILLLSQQLHDLTVASTSTCQSPAPSASHERAASPPPWSFCYKESRGVQAETALALLLLWVRLVTRHLISPDEQALLCLTMDCLASLVRRDRIFQYLIIRLWHQKSDGTRSYIPSVSIQTFCLETFVDWRRGPAGGAENEACSGKKRSKVPVTSSQLASLLQLWDVLAARQPLEVQAENYPLLTECLLHSVYTAASTPAPLSPTRRERTVAPTTMTMERKDKKTKRVGRGKRRSGCTRGKGASPCVAPGAFWDEDEEEAGKEVEEEEEEGAVEEREEPDGISERLTMKTSGYQDEEEEVWEEEPNLLLLPSLHILAHAARGSPSFRLFLKALDHQEEHLIFDALLSLVVSAQSQPSATPLMSLATLGALSRLVAGDAHFESRVFDRGNVRETTKLIFSCLLSFENEGEREEGERARAAVDLWGDFLSSPLVLGFLEEQDGWQEGEGLPYFLVKVVVALGDQDEREGGEERIEALLWALRVVCEESPLGQSLLIRSFLPLVDENEKEEREGGQHGIYLTKLVELALSTHVPTAMKAVILLQQLHLGACGETSHRLWVALTVALTSATTSRSSISGSHGASSPSSSRAWPRVAPPSATIQLSRSPLRRRRQQAVVAAAAGANTGTRSYAPSLLDLLVDRLHALADEVEVCCGGSGLEGLEIGSRGLNEAVFLELEWSLRPVLSLLCWVMTTAFCHAPSSSYGVDLRREVALRLDARGVSVIVLGVAHVRHQVWQEELRKMTEVVRNPMSSTENLVMRSNCLSRVTLMEKTLGGVPSMCPVERLEIVVKGCRLMLLLGSVCGTASGGEEEEEGEVEWKKAEWPNRLMSKENSRHRYWLSIALNSSAVIDILAAVLHQGTDRELVSQTLSFLTDLKNTNNTTSRQGEGDGEEGPEWSGLMDGLFRRNQAMHGCLQVLEKEMTDLTNENGKMMIKLRENNKFVEEAEGQRAALQVAHDQEMERVGQDWREEVLKMREAAKVERGKHNAERAGIISDREGWQARAQAAETELAQMQEAQQATEIETIALQKHVEALTVQLMQCQKESMTHEARAAELASEVEEHRQRAYDACRQKEEAEEVMRKSNAQVDKALKKMTVFSDAFKAKDEAVRAGEARLRKLDVHVGGMEKELAILRGRLTEAEGESRRLAALHEAEAAHREQEEQAGEEEMKRMLEDMKALRMLVEVKTEAMRELEYAHQQALDELQEKDGLLMDQDEVLRRQQHAAALIKQLVTAVEEDNEEGELEEGGRGNNVYNLFHVQSRAI